MNRKPIIYFALLLGSIIALVASCLPKAYIKTNSYANFRQLPGDALFIQPDLPTNEDIAHILKTKLLQKGFTLAQTRPQAGFVLSYKIVDAFLPAQATVNFRAEPRSQLRTYALSEKTADLSPGRVKILTLILSQMRGPHSTKSMKLWEGSGTISDGWYESHIDNLIQLVLDYLGHDFSGTVMVN